MIDFHLARMSKLCGSRAHTHTRMNTCLSCAAVSICLGASRRAIATRAIAEMQSTIATAPCRFWPATLLPLRPPAAAATPSSTRKTRPPPLAPVACAPQCAACCARLCFLLASLFVVLLLRLFLSPAHSLALCVSPIRLRLRTFSIGTLSPSSCALSAVPSLNHTLARTSFSSN